MITFSFAANMSLLLQTILFLNHSSKCWAWSNSPNGSSSLTSRRKLLINSGVLGSLLLPNNKPAWCACLPGDDRPECIGVYKVPIDPAILPYVETPEKLKSFAPDLKYVPPIQSPKSYKQAVEILESQRLAADDIVNVISAGRLEEAGIKVLNLLPKMTSAGKLIVDTLQGELNSKPSSSDTINELRLSKLAQEFQMMVGLWNEADIVIGQGLRGELGVSAVAQIQILSSLRDAIAATDDFLVTVSRRAN